MSGWIKLEKDLETDPRVLRLAKRISVTGGNAGAYHYVTQVVGALARLWMFADSHIRDDDTLDMSPDELDDWLGIPGFCTSMPGDWLIICPEGGVELPGFQAHNGVEAKSKALTQKRVERHRKRDSVTPSNAHALPDQTRPDQKRPDQTKKRGSGGDAAKSTRPAQQIPIGLALLTWKRWQDYRRSIGKPIREASEAAAMQQLAKLGNEAEQSAAVEHSIANGWQGLFAPKTVNGSGTTHEAAPRKTRYEQAKEALERATEN